MNIDLENENIFNKCIVFKDKILHMIGSHMNEFSYWDTLDI